VSITANSLGFARYYRSMKKAFIGIDIAKRLHFAYATGAINGDGKAFSFTHRSTGFDNLITWLEEVAPGQEWVFALEPTEPFSGALASWLRMQGYSVHLIPGVYTQRARYFYTKDRMKNDTVDAQILAELLRDGHYKEHMPTCHAAKELRELGQRYLRIATMRRASAQRLNCLIDLVWPEFTSLIRIKTHTAKAILREFRGPGAVAAMPESQFVEWVTKVSRWQIKNGAEIHQSACVTVGTTLKSSAQELMMELDLLEYFERCYDELQASIEGWLKQVDYADLLLSIPGFGPLATGLLIGFAGDLRKYPTVNHLYKVAGLNLVERSSGGYKSPMHISKSGNAGLRRVLFSAAASQTGMRLSGAEKGNRTITHQGIFREWYLKRKEDKHRTKLIVALTRRMLRIAHAVVRDGVPFDKSRYLATLVIT
jgi:transposase